MKKYGLLSVLIFFVSFCVFFISMFKTGDMFSGKVMILIAVVLPMMGLIIGFKGSGNFKTIGILGNTLILLFSAIIPFTSTFFWNQP